MQSRFNVMELVPDACAALLKVEAYLADCGLEHALLALVKMRASQINGCAYCLDMHSREARRLGETERRLYLLNAWRDSRLYTARERAALAWTERLTLVAVHGAPDADYEAMTRAFSLVEIVNLTTAIGMINLWNRLMIAARQPYTTGMPAAA
jgi:AhpD family alkylhydroperoxidase